MAKKLNLDKLERIELGIPPLYILIDRPMRWAMSGLGAHVGDHRMQAGDEYRTVHVISPAVGGEIRGYRLVGNTLHLRTPAMPYSWPEVDAAAIEALMHYGACRVEVK